MLGRVRLPASSGRRLTGRPRLAAAGLIAGLFAFASTLGVASAASPTPGVIADASSARQIAASPTARAGSPTGVAGAGRSSAQVVATLTPTARPPAPTATPTTPATRPPASTAGASATALPPTPTPAPSKAASTATAEPSSSAVATARDASIGAGQATPPVGHVREGAAVRSAAVAAAANQPSLAPAPPLRITFVVPGATVAPVATATPIMIPQLSPTGGAVRGWIEGALLALDVPIRSQFDGSEYQASNCGPTSMAMVLDAFGVDVPTARLRNLANLLQGTYDRETGIALDYLGEIAREAGLRPLGLRTGSAYRRWSVADLRAEVRRGHPVVTLVKMRELPDHAASRTDTDHYVVVVGLDGDNLLINDPAVAGDQGFRRPIGPAQLERAWDAASIPRQAIAIAAGDGVPELTFPDPLGPAAPQPTGPLEPVMVLPQVSLSALGAPAEGAGAAGGLSWTPTAGIASVALPQQAPGWPASGSTGASAAGAGPVVVVITPGPPQVIVLQVPPPALTTPTPLPASARWARPAADPPLRGDQVADGCHGSAWTGRMPDGRSGCEPLVLAQSVAPRPTDEWLMRSLVITGELLASVVVLRWALR